MSAPIRSATSNHVINKEPNSPEELYCDLLKKCLTRLLFGERRMDPSADPLRVLYTPAYKARDLVYVAVTRHAPFAELPLRKLLNPFLSELRRHDTPCDAPFDARARIEGRDWPGEAETMIGLRRLDNLQYCITDILRRRVPGDLIETGVWRGGATIFMRGVLKAYGETERIVWVADSFQGLPKPDPQRQQSLSDEADSLWQEPRLAIPLEEVKANFARYGLLDAQVRFLVGWFRDTLPAAPIERLAILRLDGDMYESTMDALRALYPKLAVGGYLIIDDYYSVLQCKAAVHDYRAEHGITEQIERIDADGAFWQRLS